MIAIPPDLHFIRPYAFSLAFAVFGIIILYALLTLYRKKVLDSLNLDTEAPRSSLFHRLKVILLCLVWILATFAVMGPEGDAHYPEEETTAPAVKEAVILIDVSDSMSVSDTRIGLSRLDHAKEIADDLAAKLAGSNLALYTFTSELAQHVPPTLDALFVRLMINRLRINEGGIPGTDFLQVLEELKNSLADRRPTIVLISDGGDTKWEILTGSEKEERLSQITEVFREAQIPIITVGVGSDTPAAIPDVTYNGQPVFTKLRPEILQALGPYYQANEFTALRLSNEISELARRETDETIQDRATQVVYTQYFQIPLFLSLMCLLAVLALPEIRRSAFLLAAMMIFPLGGETIETANVYANTGFYTQAEDQYRQLLSRPLEIWQQDIVFFNLGTLYLKQGLWQQAIDEFVKITGDEASFDFLKKVRLNLSEAVLGAAKQQLDEGRPSSSLVLLSVFAEESPLFQKARASLPPDSARDALLTALKKNQSPNLDMLNGYPLTLAKLSDGLPGPSRKIALIAALAAVNRERPSPETPEAIRILRQALEEQKRSQDLSYLASLMKFEGAVSPEIVNLIRERQKGAIQSAEGFAPAAIEMQKQACQKWTWRQVFPRFGEGLQLANHSEGLLRENEPLWMVNLYQNETIQLWTLSLDYLQMTEPSSAPEETKAVASEDTQQLLQTVIEMNLQDETAQKPVPDVKPVERPW